MEIISIQEEYLSINILLNKKITKNKINLNKESEKYIVNKINIFGNNVTTRKCNKKSFSLDEGDPFNEILIKNYKFNTIIRLF